MLTKSWTRRTLCPKLFFGLLKCSDNRFDGHGSAPVPQFLPDPCGKPVSLGTLQLRITSVKFFGYRLNLLILVLFLVLPPHILTSKRRGALGVGQGECVIAFEQFFGLRGDFDDVHAGG